MATDKKRSDGMILIEGRDGIEFAQLAALKGAVGLEVRGFRRRGRSAYAMAKELYGLRGSKRKVHEQLCAMVEEILAAREEERNAG